MGVGAQPRRVHLPRRPPLPTPGARRIGAPRPRHPWCLAARNGALQAHLQRPSSNDFQKDKAKS